MAQVSTTRGYIGKGKISIIPKTGDKTPVEIAAAYSENNKRNIKKAQKAKLSIIKLNTANELIAFRKKYLANELDGTQTAADAERLKRILEKALSLNKGFIKGVVDEHNQLLALAFFMSSNNFLIYLSEWKRMSKN